MGFITPGKRSRLELASDILQVARTGATKTRIVYAANLNFRLASRYLDVLERSGLIEPIPPIGNRYGRTYRSTKIGIDFVKSLRDIEAPLIELGGETVSLFSRGRNNTLGRVKPKTVPNRISSSNP